MMRGTAAESNLLLNVPHEHSRLFLNSPNDLSDFQRCSGSYFAAAVSSVFFFFLVPSVHWDKKCSVVRFILFSGGFSLIVGK